MSLKYFILFGFIYYLFAPVLQCSPVKVSFLEGEVLDSQCWGFMSCEQVPSLTWFDSHTRRSLHQSLSAFKLLLFNTVNYKLLFPFELYCYKVFRKTCLQDFFFSFNAFLLLPVLKILYLLVFQFLWEDNWCVRCDSQLGRKQPIPGPICHQSLACQPN